MSETELEITTKLNLNSLFIKWCEADSRLTTWLEMANQTLVDLPRDAKHQILASPNEKKPSTSTSISIANEVNTTHENKEDLLAEKIEIIKHGIATTLKLERTQKNEAVLNYLVMNGNQGGYSWAYLATLKDGAGNFIDSQLAGNDGDRERYLWLDKDGVINIKQTITVEYIDIISDVKKKPLKSKQELVFKVIYKKDTNLPWNVIIQDAKLSIKFDVLQPDWVDQKGASIQNIVEKATENIKKQLEKSSKMLKPNLEKIAQFGAMNKALESARQKAGHSIVADMEVNATKPKWWQVGLSIAVGLMTVAVVGIGIVALVSPPMLAVALAAIGVATTTATVLGVGVGGIVGGLAAGFGLMFEWHKWKKNTQVNPTMAKIDTKNLKSIYYQQQVEGIKGAANNEAANNEAANKEIDAEGEADEQKADEQKMRKR